LYGLFITLSRTHNQTVQYHLPLDIFRFAPL